MPPRALVIDKARVCLERDLATDLASRWSFAFQLLHLSFAVVSYYFLSAQFREVGGAGYPAFPFLLVGIAVQGYMTTVLVTFAQVVRDHQIAGTLKAVLTTRTSPIAFLLLSSLYPLCRTTLDAGAYLVAGRALGFSIASGNAGGALLVFLVSLVAFGALGIGLASLSLVSNRGAMGVTVVVSASWLLSGGLYPPDVLPSYLQDVSTLLPATHAVSALRATLIGNSPIAAVLPQLAALTLFSILTIPAGLAAFGLGLRRARVCGALGHF